MTCPDCGDTEQQERVGSVNEAAEHTGYCCSKCGRFYSVPTDVADLTHLLEEMKARLQDLDVEVGNLVRQIADGEAKLVELRERHASDTRGEERP